MGSESLLAIFEALFPVDFVKKVMPPEMNKNLAAPMTHGEFLQWIGVTIVMATAHHSNRCEFFSGKLVDKCSGAPF